MDLQLRNTLLLRADPVDNGAWHWLRLDTEGNQPGGTRTGSLAEAAAEAAGLKALVLAPAIDCLLTRVRIPGHNRQKLLRAVPYALEEQVSDEVEHLHFALGQAQLEGEWPVAVINRRYMEDLLAETAAAGLDVQQVIPEQLAVPCVEHETGVVISNGMALVRNGDYSGYAVEAENLGMFLAATGADAEEPPVLQLYLQEGGDVPDTAGYSGEIRTTTYAGDPLTLYAQGLDNRVINLLQGAYGRSGEWARILRPWRATAALLLAGIVVSNVAVGVDYFRLSKESTQLREQIEATYREAFPETRRVVNPRVQMQQQLDRLQHRQGAGGDFLELLGRTGKVLKDIQGIEATGASFRAGRLDLDVTATDLQLLDKLKQDLARDGGLAVEIQSATAGSDKRVQGRLRIQGSGS
jgi:general secretion pathway protein L